MMGDGIGKPPDAAAHCEDPGVGPLKKLRHARVVPDHVVFADSLGVLGDGLPVIEGELLVEIEDAGGNLHARPPATRTAPAGLIHYQTPSEHKWA